MTTAATSNFYQKHADHLSLLNNNNNNLTKSEENKSLKSSIYLCQIMSSSESSSKVQSESFNNNSNKIENASCNNEVLMDKESNGKQLQDINNLMNNQQKHHNDNKTRLYELQKEQEDFNNRLVEFNRHKNVNTPIISWPTFNGKYVNLHKLYTKVIEMGGWERVCEKEKWNEICSYLDKAILISCTNSSHAIKLIYLRYLSLYEKIHNSPVNQALGDQLNLLPVGFYIDNYFKSMPNAALLPNMNNASSSSSLNNNANLNSNSLALGVGYRNSSSNQSLPLSLRDAAAEDKDDDLLGHNNKKRFNYLYDSVPMNYNYNQHVVNNNNSNANISSQYSIDSLSNVNTNSHSIISTQTSTSTITPLLPSSTFTFNPYEKLENSLNSGLPNEIDFVFNTIVLLSSDESHSFRVYSSPRLIQLMLAHIGFFGTDDKFNYRYLYDNVWNSYSNDDSLQEAKTNTNLDNLNDRMINKLKCKPRRNFVKFWHNAIKFPDKCQNLDINYKSFFSQLLPKLYNDFLQTLPAQELLNLREMKQDINGNNSTPHGCLDSVEFRRIEQVMISLNNLSFEETNADYMANNCVTLIEFLIMCLYCTGSCIDLRKHALDILANLSRKIKLKNISEKHKSLILMSIFYLIIGHQQEQEQDQINLNDFEINNDTTVTSTLNTNLINNISAQDRLNIIRGTEILTKLCSQNVELNEQDNFTNEKILTRFIFEKSSHINKELKYLECIIARFEQLLSIQDVLILMHCLECLYSMTQFSESMCNLIAQQSFETSNSSPKIISILVNFLTVDVTHFGVQPSKNLSSSSSVNTCTTSTGPIKVCKIMPVNSNLMIQSSAINPSQAQSIVASTSPHQQSSSNHANSIKNSSLLQQTLHNQHNMNATNSSLASSKNQLVNNQSSNTSNKHTTHEQNARNILSNWLLTCFQAEQNSELSKTQLYPYYQQIAKMNNWPVLTIPTFFETLNSTFSNLKYDEHSNKIQGLKLVLNVKQQIQLKNQQQFTQSTNSINVSQKQQNTNASDNYNASNMDTSEKPTFTSDALNITQSVNTPSSKEEAKSNTNVNKDNPLENQLSIIQIPSNPLTTPLTPSPNNSNHQQHHQKENVLQSSSILQASDLNIINSNEASSNLIEASKSLEQSSEIKEINNINTKGENSNMLSNLKEEEKMIQNIESRINTIKQINMHNQQFDQTNGAIKATEDSLNLQNDDKNSALNKENNEAEKLVKENDKQTENNLKSNNLNPFGELTDENSSSSTSSSLTSSTSNSSSASSENANSTTLKKRKNSLTDTEKNMGNVPNKQTKIANEFEESSNNQTTKLMEQSNDTLASSSTLDPSLPSMNQCDNMEVSEKNSGITTDKMQIDSQHLNNSDRHTEISNQNKKQITHEQENQTSSEINKVKSVNGGEYLCEWNNCKRLFPTAKAVYNHVCKYHLLDQSNKTFANTEENNSGTLCLWSHCDQIKRQKWSLINHLQERHCNETALRTAIVLRQRGLIPATNQSTTLNGLGNYSKDAALLAIQRHQRVKKEDFLSGEEGPITKSIRLLSALTLRNLAKNSDKAKIAIKQHESLLASIAFDLLESSQAIANCLWHLSH